MTETGEKMSKSLGNAVEPVDVIRQSGAEIIRLWVAMVDFNEDQRIGPTILQTTTDAYRKLRNTLRYLLGGLEGFTESERLGYDQMPALERHILHRLWELDGLVRDAYVHNRFNEVFRPVSEFCAGDLSSFYFDIRKDGLYCDRPESLRRRAVRTVMDEIFNRLTMWLAPLAPFTTEEAWTTRFADRGPNAMRVLPDRVEGWRNPSEAARWRTVHEVLDTVTNDLEGLRRQKTIGSAYEAAAHVVADDVVEAAFAGLDPAEIFRTSSATITRSESPGFSVSVTLAEGLKCERCWRVLPEVSPLAHLCRRCEEAVADWDVAHVS